MGLLFQPCGHFSTENFFRQPPPHTHTHLPRAAQKNGVRPGHPAHMGLGKISQRRCSGVILLINSAFLTQHVFSRMGSIWKMERSWDRANSSRSDVRVFFSRTICFLVGGCLHDFGRFSLILRIGPEVTVGCLGVVSTHY